MLLNNQLIVAIPYIPMHTHTSCHENSCIICTGNRMAWSEWHLLGPKWQGWPNWIYPLMSPDPLLLQKRSRQKIAILHTPSWQDRKGLFEEGARWIGRKIDGGGSICGMLKGGSRLPLVKRAPKSVIPLPQSSCHGKAGQAQTDQKIFRWPKYKTGTSNSTQWSIVPHNYNKTSPSLPLSSFSSEVSKGNIKHLFHISL